MRQATQELLATVGRVVEARGHTKRKHNKPVFAYVNHGRWVADCPCGGAELVARGEPFLCGSCGLTASVEWPPNQADIERLLAGRPNVTNQNWWFEPAELLEAENKWMVN